MTQYAFYFDATRCWGCRTCQVACKDRLGLAKPGAIPRRVSTWESGAYPKSATFHLSISCNHCASPACVENCPTGAMAKNNDGIVLHDDEACIGCLTCVSACPYGAPQFDEESSLVIKCDTCLALRENGMNPVCVDACLGRALDFGTLEEMKEKYGDSLVGTLPVLPPDDITTPGLVIKPSAPSQIDDAREVLL